MNSSFKQAIVIRQDLDMSTGKMISQACHASLGAYKKAEEELVEEWESEGSKKVVLSAGGKDIRELRSQAKRNKIPASLVKDAGLTELEPGTSTAIGIGPDKSEKVDQVTGDLELIS